VAQHAETRTLPYTADLLYQIVADIERYPEFLPWCRALRLLSREQAADGEVLQAKMEVGFGALSGSYVSRVVLHPGTRSIDVTQAQGPFRSLQTRWRFTPDGEGTKVDFFIAFEFRNPLLNAIAAGAFEPALRQMQAAFADRAHQMQRDGTISPPAGAS